MMHNVCGVDGSRSSSDRQTETAMADIQVTDDDDDVTNVTDSAKPSSSSSAAAAAAATFNVAVGESTVPQHSALRYRFVLGAMQTLAL